MKTEISAGGVVVRKKKTGWQVLLMCDMNDTWTFPKGTIEKGETEKSAAFREIGEEVGLTKLRLIAPLSTISYVYKRKRLIHKTVHYFIFEQTENEVPVCQRSEGIKAARWFTLTAALRRIGYKKTNTQLLEKVRQVLPI